jgi:hypothetical protein
VTVAVIVLPYLGKPTPGWKLYFKRLGRCGAIFLIRMDKVNNDLLDFHLIPRTVFDTSGFRFTEDRMKHFMRYKLRSVSSLNRALRQIQQIERIDSVPAKRR